MKIAVYNHKGGVGKSTLTSHLGFYAKKHDLNVAVVDADRQHNTISWLTGHTWTGDSEYTDGSLYVTTNDVEVDNYDYIIYDCPPAYEVAERLKNKIDKWIIPVDGRFSLEGAMNVISEVKTFDSGADFYIVVNKAIDNKFGNKERSEIKKLGLKVFNLEIPQSDVIRKSEMYGLPAWKIAYGSRSLSTQNIELFCKWVFGNFNSRGLV